MAGTGENAAASAGGLVMVAVGEIRPGQFQPRRHFSEESLRGLLGSIQEHGVVQPIVVRPAAQRAGGPRYELVAGERRWRASQLAGKAEIPAIVRELTDEQAAEWGLVENVQREDLNPIERAQALSQLLTTFKMSQQAVATRIGMERSTVANLVRLLELEASLQELLSLGKLGFAHGRALLMAPPGASREELGARAAEGGWTVRKLDEAIAALTRSSSASGATVKAIDGGRAAARAALEKAVGEHLGTKVRIQTDRSGARGRLVVDFYGLDHFDGLLAKMGYGGGK